MDTITVVINTRMLPLISMCITVMSKRVTPIKTTSQPPAAP
jgi:hypothetical protein